MKTSRRCDDYINPPFHSTLPLSVDYFFAQSCNKQSIRKTINFVNMLNLYIQPRGGKLKERSDCHGFHIHESKLPGHDAPV